MRKDTPRIPPLPPEDWDNPAREVFAFWGEPDSWRDGSKTNIVMTLAQHPKLATAYNIFGKHLLIDSTLSGRVKELVVIRISWRLKCDYEWHYHIGYCVNLGMSLDEIAAIKDGANAAIWNEADRAVLNAVDEFIDASRLSDSTWNALSAHFDRQQIMDLVFTIGHYVMLSWAVTAFGIQLEDGVDPIGYDLRTASGNSPSARFRPAEVKDWAENQTNDLKRGD